jgi:FeS assembly SUF system regulator
MLRLSRLADYAVVILVALARQEGQAATARWLAERTEVPWPTAVKLLKLLAAAGLLRSTQGRQGGYGLARPPQEISLAEVVEAVEGPIALTECTRPGGACGIRTTCVVEPHWSPINGAMRATLAGISLAQLAASPAGREGAANAGDSAAAPWTREVS